MSGWHWALTPFCKGERHWEPIFSPGLSSSQPPVFYNHFPPQLFTLKNFKPTENLKEPYNEHLYSVHLNTTINIHLLLFSVCTHPPTHSCCFNKCRQNAHFWILQHVFPGVKGIILCNHNTIQLPNHRTLILIQYYYLIYAPGINFTIV